MVGIQYLFLWALNFDAINVRKIFVWLTMSKKWMHSERGIFFNADDFYSKKQNFSRNTWNGMIEECILKGKCWDL